MYRILLALTILSTTGCTWAPVLPAPARITVTLPKYGVSVTTSFREQEYTHDAKTVAR